MKQLSPLFAFLFLAHISFGQTSLVNFKEGTWKNKQSWLYQQIPADTNDVVLMHDIVVDTNAICRSLTTNGYNVTIANGFNLKITGQDTIGSIRDNDTLISKITVVYSGNGLTYDTMNANYQFYEYDSLKRVSKIITPGNTSSAQKWYYYTGNSTVPSKTISIDTCRSKLNGNCIPAYDTSFFTYNDQQIVIKDSSVSIRSEEKLKYKRTNSFIISGDSVIRHSHYNTFNVSYVNGIKEMNEVFLNDTTYFYRLLENGNIVYQIDSSQNGRSEHVIRYDQNTNPRYNISIHLPVIGFEAFLFDDPEQKNNILSFDETYSLPAYGGVTNNKYRYSFKYKSNHYPSELFMLNKGSINIIKFYYTK